MDEYVEMQTNVLKNKQMDKEKYEQTDRWTKQKDVKISKWRDRQTNRKTDQ